MRSAFSAEEYRHRIHALQQALQAKALDAALILDDVNQFYYAGTSQTGTLVIPSTGLPRYFVKRSRARAEEESWLAAHGAIAPLRNFRDMKASLQQGGIALDRLGVLKANISLADVERLQASGFENASLIDISPDVRLLRAVKSPREVELMREAGRRQAEVFREIPEMLRVGVSEWELSLAVRAMLLEREDAGFSRLSTGNRPPSMGNFCFGDSALHPVAFDGPGGVRGLNPAFPVSGSTEKRLERHEPVYIDFVFSHQGYFTDQTRMFALGELPSAATRAHQDCLTIQREIVARLKPGAIPSVLYQEVNALVDEMGIQDGFMGYGENKVKFFGHGIGLVIDEFPVIANGFDQPLQAGMVLAIEPKRALERIGMVGIENTWLITPEGASPLTHGPDELLTLP